MELLQTVSQGLSLQEFLSMEKMYTPKQDYIQTVQNYSIEEWMRSDLVEWMIEVCFQCRLSCIGLSVNYVDRYLSSKQVLPSQLQCVGASALLIASKIKEINPLSVSQLCSLSDNAFSSDNLKEAEQFMLNVLTWRLNPVTPDEIFELILMTLDVEPEQVAAIRKYSLLIIEMSYIEFQFLKFEPSILAAGALLNALFFINSPYVKSAVNDLSLILNSSKNYILTCSNNLHTVFSAMVSGGQEPEPNVCNMEQQNEVNFAAHQQYEHSSCDSFQYNYQSNDDIEEDEIYCDNDDDSESEIPTNSFTALSNKDHQSRNPLTSIHTHDASFPHGTFQP
eukprot:Awhi_evm1s11112